MTAKSIVVMLLRAVLVGLLFAVALSGEALISVQSWVAAGAVWVVGSLLREFIVVAAVEPAGFAVAWSGRGRRRRPVYGLSGLQAIDAVLVDARSNPRAHANRLRPRLVALAEHYLPIRHGIDLNHDPARVAALLGHVAWLIDPTVINRTPTAPEIQRFFDVILAEQEKTAATHRHEGPVAAQ